MGFLFAIEYKQCLVKVAIAGFVCVTGLVSADIHVAHDVLHTPAILTKAATHHLLLDIEKVGNRLVAVGTKGHIIFSDNEGKSWRQASAPVSVLLTALSFADEKNGLAVGHGGIVLRTANSGQSWSKVLDGNFANQKVIDEAQYRVATSRVYFNISSADNAEVLKRELKEAQFSVEDAEHDANIGASKPFLDVLFLNKRDGFAVGAYGFIFKTEDGGESWENYGSRLDNPQSRHLNAITRINGGTLLICGESGVLFRSVDEGETWASVSSPYEGSFFGISGTGDQDVAIVFGLRGNLFRSEDGGQSWKMINSGTNSTLMAAAFDDSGNLSIVGNSGIVLLSEDGGRTYSARTRKNRLGNVSAVYLDGPRMVMVGENGINLTTPAGHNL